MGARGTHGAWSRGVISLAAAVTIGSACAQDGAVDAGTVDLRARPDMPLFPVEDFASEWPDLAVSGLSACGRPLPDPSCIDFARGDGAPAFALMGDAKPDPAVRHQGVRRDGDGHLVLDGGTNGRWAVRIEGCADVMAVPYDTQWAQLAWIADTPPGTSLTVTAHSGNVPDVAQWRDPFTSPTTFSPLSLFDQLVPSPRDWMCGHNLKNHYLEVEFVWKTADPRFTPSLRQLHVGYRCQCEG